MPIKLIVGLKNPGAEYQNTRHNAGDWLVQSLVKHSAVSLKFDKKLHGEIAECQYNEVAFKVLLPTTFMNHSGRAVRAACQFYKIPLDQILIVHDELDIEPGRIKLKVGGGHGGHNGLRDIAAQMGSNAFLRLRVGIGHPGHKDLVTPYVLGKPNVQDKQRIQDAIERALQNITTIVSKDIAIAMNEING